MKVEVEGEASNERFFVCFLNNAIIIISNQISVTEAKNTHHIKAMTRREMKWGGKKHRNQKDSLIFLFISFLFLDEARLRRSFNSVRQNQESRVQWGGEAILRLFHFIFIILRDVSFNWEVLELFIPIMYVICFGRFVCNYLFFAFVCFTFFLTVKSKFPFLFVSSPSWRSAGQM